MKKLFIILAIIFLPLAAKAAETGFLDSLACIKTGDCQLADVAVGFTLLIKKLLGYMGAVALLFFVIGGFKWLTSRGNPESVRTGQRIMTNTVIAIFIAFTSYLLLSFFVNNILGVRSDFGRIGSGPAECEGKTNGTACQVVEGREVNPYECYNQKCETKCYVKAKMTGLRWECYNIINPDLLPAAEIYYVRNLCSGDEHMICTLLNEQGNPADPTWQIYLDRMNNGGI